jgi:hypothetical protein
LLRACNGVVLSNAPASVKNKPTQVSHDGASRGGAGGRLPRRSSVRVCLRAVGPS